MRTESWIKKRRFRALRTVVRSATRRPAPGIGTGVHNAGVNAAPDRQFPGPHAITLPSRSLRVNIAHVRIAIRKLQQVSAADLSFLRVPPGNRLEQLRKDRAGRWRIRITDQWRVCFEWHEARAARIEVLDHH